MLHTQELLNHSVRNAFTGFSIPIIVLVWLLTHTFPGFGQCAAPSFAPATNFAAGDGPYIMAVGDFNGDTKLDLAVPNINADRVSILLGNGAGSFMLGGSFPVGRAPTAAAAGDFNSDGKLDLAVVNFASFGNPPGDMSILIGNGAGGFSAPTSYRVIAFNSDVTATDLNNDGKFDIVAGTYSEQVGNVKVLLGDGTGSFGAIADFGGNGDARSPVVADFNGDGKLDVAVAINNEVGRDFHTGTRISVLLGDGTGRFGAPTYFTVGIGPISMAGGDLNGDGKLDLVVANGTSNNVSVLLGDGLGGFGAATNLALQGFPNSVRLGDLNGDSKLDLVVSSGVSGSVSVLLGNGGGEFSLPTEFAVGTGPVSVVLGDFNGDSKKDIAIANFGSDDVSILINTCSSAPATICKEAILSPVVSGPAGGKAEIALVQSDTEIHQQFSVRIERALANNSYRVLVEISSGEPVDLGQQLDFGFVETDRDGNANVTWSSSPKNGERDIRPLLPPGNDVRNFTGVMVAHGGGTIISLSGKFSFCRANFIPVESSSRPADSQARVLPPSSVATPDSKPDRDNRMNAGERRLLADIQTARDPKILLADSQSRR
jgi:hypothetical protein